MTYWVALALFAVGVMVPEMVRHGLWLLREDETETILLLILVGALFVTYLLTDRRLRATGGRLRAREQELRDATKDLAAAYGHIGEVNRKIDIVRDCGDRIARHGATMDGVSLCRIVRRAARALTRATVCHVYLVAVDGSVQGVSPRSPLPDTATALSLLTLRSHQTVEQMAPWSQRLTVGASRTADGRTIVILYAANGALMTHDETDAMLLGMVADLAVGVRRVHGV